MGSSRNPRRNIVLAILVISLSLGICYVKLKYFLRPREEIYSNQSGNIKTTTTPDHAPSAPSDPPSIAIDPIHIVLSVDRDDFIAVPTLLNSLSKHSSNSVTVHIVVTGDTKQLESFIDCCKLDKNIEVNIQKFELPEDFKNLITVTGDPLIYGKLTSEANFARFFFHKIFPSIKYMLYIDVDSTIQHDIISLWREVTTGDQLITSTTIPDRTYGSYLKPIVKDIFDKRHGDPLDLSTPCIIGGMYGVNLDSWRELDVTQEVEFWMKEHHAHLLWSLGSQPLLMLVGYGRMKLVSRKWNLTGLGWNTKYQPEELSEGYILHWNGMHKPWMEDGLYKDAWNQYSPDLLDECTQKF